MGTRFDGTYPVPAERTARIGEPVRTKGDIDPTIIEGRPGWEWVEPKPGRPDFTTREPAKGR